MQSHASCTFCSFCSLQALTDWQAPMLHVCRHAAAVAWALLQWSFCFHAVVRPCTDVILCTDPPVLCCIDIMLAVHEGPLCILQGQIEGGFMGRTNKLVDGCYSFWQGGIFPLLQRLWPEYLAQTKVPGKPSLYPAAFSRAA